MNILTIRRILDTVIPRLLLYPDLCEFGVTRFSNFVNTFFSFYETQVESMQEPEEIVDLAWQINLEVDSDGVQELLDSHNQELRSDELIEEQEQWRNERRLPSPPRRQGLGS
ncbi:hypothetical protein TNCV_1931901 [Trichonephila clavipes]|nr:hypothetical protein TNCV_1931901 [Trichonephila clavipes]